MAPRGRCSDKPMRSVPASLFTQRCISAASRTAPRPVATRSWDRRKRGSWLSRNARIPLQPRSVVHRMSAVTIMATNVCTIPGAATAPLVPPTKATAARAARRRRRCCHRRSFGVSREARPCRGRCRRRASRLRRCVCSAQCTIVERVVASTGTSIMVIMVSQKMPSQFTGRTIETLFTGARIIVDNDRRNGWTPPCGSASTPTWAQARFRGR